MILNALQSALIWIANERGWDTRGLESCYAEAISRNLTFEGWSKKSWASPNGKYRARIGFSFRLRAVDFFVGVFDRRGREIGRKPLGSVAPEMDIPRPILTGTATWNSANAFRVRFRYSVYMRKSWQVNLLDLLPGE
jgi:hypothetical protein